jgi:hypothetical protein
MLMPYVSAQITIGRPLMHLTTLHTSMLTDYGLNNEDSIPPTSTSAAETNQPPFQPASGRGALLKSMTYRDNYMSNEMKDLYIGLTRLETVQESPFDNNFSVLS